MLSTKRTKESRESSKRTSPRTSWNVPRSTDLALIDVQPRKRDLCFGNTLNRERSERHRPRSRVLDSESFNRPTRDPVQCTERQLQVSWVSGEPEERTRTRPTSAGNRVGTTRCNGNREQAGGVLRDSLVSIDMGLSPKKWTERVDRRLAVRGRRGDAGNPSDRGTCSR